MIKKTILCLTLCFLTFPSQAAYKPIAQSSDNACWYFTYSLKNKAASVIQSVSPVKFCVAKYLDDKKVTKQAALKLANSLAYKVEHPDPIPMQQVEVEQMRQSALMHDELYKAKIQNEFTDPDKKDRALLEESNKNPFAYAFRNKQGKAND